MFALADPLVFALLTVLLLAGRGPWLAWGMRPLAQAAVSRATGRQTRARGTGAGSHVLPRRALPRRALSSRTISNARIISRDETHTQSACLINLPKPRAPPSFQMGKRLHARGAVDTDLTRFRPAGVVRCFSTSNTKANTHQVAGTQACLLRSWNRPWKQARAVPGRADLAAQARRHLATALNTP